ncbi:MAG: putative quinol monooxygenase [Planctomycetota bacterium]|jgi:quinol monooxygenase YgiN
MIRVIAAIELADGRRDDFLAVFRQLVPKVLSEEGCVEYGPWVDLPTNIPAQPESRHNVVTVVEKWESIQALEAHLMSPHMLEFRQATESMRVGVTLRILEPA